MSAKAFGRRIAAVGAAGGPERPDVNTLIRMISERRGSDPLICEKIAADEMLRTMTSAMAEQDSRGVHAETLIAALAGLAGYACLVSARATVALLTAAPAPVEGAGSAGTRPAVLSLDQFGGPDGRTYYLGEAIDGPLVDNQLSVWNIILGGPAASGMVDPPDRPELLAHVTASLGTAQFGLPRLALGGYPPAEPPLGFVRAFWPLLLPKAKLFCPLPEQWPVLYAFAVQQAVDLCKDAVRPHIAVRLALECAVPMSRVDPLDVA